MAKEMKIIGLCASPRTQGNTRRLLEFFLAECRGLGAETELISASDRRVEFCRACEQCMRQGDCPVQDDYLPLLPKILSADALVLATPNYAFDVSAQIKAVMDRSHAFLYYRQALAGKYGVGLCVAGHWFGSRSIARRLSQTVWLCGGASVGAAWGISKHRDKKGFEQEQKVYGQAKRLAKRLVRAVQTRRKYRWQRWLRETFNTPHLRRAFTRRAEEYPWVAERWVGK
jgi:multimeric flavodoxin WrbA